MRKTPINLKIKWWWKQKTHPLRKPEEIYKEMQNFHNLYIKYEREGLEKDAQEYRVKRDTLRWCLFMPTD